MPKTKSSSRSNAAEQDAGLQQLLLVQTGDSLLAAIDLNAVERVIPLTAVQPIPQGPAYLLGLLDLHGSGVPVMDLGLRLGLNEAAPYDLDTPIVICRRGDLLAGLVAREVVGTSRLQLDDVQLEKTFAHGSPMFQAAVSTDQGLALLVDLSRVLDPELDADPRSASAAIGLAYKEDSSSTAQQ